MPGVRAALLDWQRAYAQPPGLVADGRDMGTTVFPHAGVKIFLTASAGERAQRRHKQLKEKGLPANLAALTAEIEERDERDRSRAASPLVPASDAIEIDSTAMGIDEVVEWCCRRHTRSLQHGFSGGPGVVVQNRCPEHPGCLQSEKSGLGLPTGRMVRHRAGLEKPHV